MNIVTGDTVSPQPEFRLIIKMISPPLDMAPLDMAPLAVAPPKRKPDPRIAWARAVSGMKPRRRREPVPPDPEDLLNLTQAANRLGISRELLRDYAKAGKIRYINVARGEQREHMRFPPRDLADFVTALSKSKALPCPSTSVGKSTTSTSGAEVIGFSARRNARLSAKRKR
jgi:hypothetical protein